VKWSSTVRYIAFTPRELPLRSRSAAAGGKPHLFIRDTGTGNLLEKIDLRKHTCLSILDRLDARQQSDILHGRTGARDGPDTLWSEPNFEKGGRLLFLDLVCLHDKDE
jgi:hypothetical protein